MKNACCRCAARAEARPPMSRHSRLIHSISR
jgi:hypothetical protein